MYKMAIVTPELPISDGKLAAQVAHAAVECVMRLHKKNPSLLQKWLDEGQKKVVLSIGNEDILRLQSKASSMGLCTALIKDAGRTELPPGTTTALAIGPARDQDIDRITRQLPLK